MIFQNIVLTLKQKQELIAELTKARKRGNLTVVNRITAILAFADNGISLVDIYCENNSCEY